MNTINLGQGCLGVQTAAQRYFNKDAKDLTLSECAVIAAITQSPSNLNPVSNPEANAKRREKVLKNMKEQGSITKDEYDEAMADNVYDRISETASNTTASKPYTYFIDAVINQIVDDLVTEKSYTETQAYNLLYSGGLTIKVTQDADIQAICDDEVANVGDYLNGDTEYGLDYALTIHRADGSSENYSKEQLASYIQSAWGYDTPLLYGSEGAAQEAVDAFKSTLNINEAGGDTVDERIELSPQPQTSVVVMDQYTGQVKAIVGGRGEKNSSLSLNRATDSARQPGSCFKILAAYAPALNEGKITLATTIDDEPYTLKNGQVLRNANKQYGGTTTLREGIKRSINVVAVKLSDEITQELGYEYCQKFGISTLVKNKTINGKVFDDSTSQTLALGGITEGVYNYEMCAAYATIANGGEYNKPTLYSKVVDHDGNVLLDGTGESHTVIKDSTAYLLTNAMEDVVNSGTGTACQLPNMPVAGKTGTTTSNKDLWFCGFTPYYTASIWVGYDDNSRTVSSINHTSIWRAIMEQVHEGLPSGSFEQPDDIVQVAVCSKSGKLPVEGLCDSDPRGSCIITEYFAADNQPTEQCDTHVKVTICNDSGDVANTGCTNVTTKILTKKPSSDSLGSSESGYSTRDAEYSITEDKLTKLCSLHQSAATIPTEESSTSGETNTGAGSESTTTAATTSATNKQDSSTTKATQKTTKATQHN